MELTTSGGQLEFDCATGTITQPLTADSDGHFRVKGTFTFGHGGPTRQGEVPQTIDTVYSGVIKEGTMSLALYLNGNEQAVAHYVLQRGRHGNLVKCR